ncbi:MULTISPECIES: DUF2794 domain-containing protein [unclassified Hyphomonas]|jgi:hypothetical protein|uniref:DUF2794 domain-containing protein n=1 Tax=unclassified Hyphomonas TaxID=2630699 RepID=UPI00045918F4|nr:MULTISPECIES: DUF2794 domain-containing protein [unclassified Hyphomonas]KCZ45382.1 hypothetical protein HY17_13220 [Hyphomonas sp. CY54-11-8]RAN41710.1 hypothetical protein HY26_08000 [Hyphomonas sp. GM-8P]
MSEFPSRRAQSEPRIAFHKTEMRPILDVYGRLVMAGEARDYAIGMHKDHAIFAIFRRHAENPTWRIEKQPHLANMQGQYVVYGQAGQVLRRGRDLQQVLRVFDRKRFTVVK